MRSIHFFLALPLLASIVPFACGGGDDSSSSSSKPKETPGDALCKQIAAYAQQCGASAGQCDQALVADCANVVGLLSDGFITAVSDCIKANSGASPMACFTQALTTLMPGPAQMDLIHGICTTCTDVPGVPDSVEQTCESAFVQGFDVPDPLGGDPTHVNVGALFAAVGNGVAQALQTECITGVTDCIPATFSTCAQKVLAEKAFPQNTVDCFLNSILGGGSGSSTGSGGGSASGSCVMSGAGGGATAAGAGGASTTTTSSATTSSGSGSTAASTGSSMTGCDNQHDCGACQTCAVSATCKSEADICFADSECTAIIQCESTCADNDLACDQACIDAHPNGQNNLATLGNCLYCTACPVDCDGPGAGCP